MEMLDIDVTVDLTNDYLTTTYQNVTIWMETLTENINATQDTNVNDLPRMINIIFRPIWVVIGTIGQYHTIYHNL